MKPRGAGLYALRASVKKDRACGHARPNEHWMKILSVISWITKLFRGTPRLDMEKKDQTIKKATGSVNIQVRGDEISSKKGDAIKTGAGSPVVRGDSATIYQNCTFIFTPERFLEAKDKTKRVLEIDLPQKFPALDEKQIKIAVKIVTDSGSPAILSTAIPKISGMLSEGSHGEIPPVTILNEFRDKLSGYILDYSNSWTCPNCGHINLCDANFSIDHTPNVCDKCKMRRPKS